MCFASISESILFIVFFSFTVDQDGFPAWIVCWRICPVAGVWTACPLKVPSSLAFSNPRRIPKIPCKGHRLRSAVTGRGLCQPNSRFFPACLLSDSPSMVTHGGEAEHATCLVAAGMDDTVSPGPQATGMLTDRPGVQTAAHSALSVSFIPVLHHQGSSLGSMTFLWKGP